MTNGKPPMTQTAASIFQEICYANKDRLSYVPPTPFQVQTKLILISSTGLASSLLVGMSDSVAKFTPFPWAVHFTSNLMLSAVQDRLTSMVTVMPTGERAWRRMMQSTSSREP